MKRLMKRWLAMVLVVLMVGGMLPTQALAARMETDERVETPVLDDGDKAGLSERPVDPGDTDPLPVDPFWSDTTGITAKINPDGSWEVVVTTNDAVGTIGSWGIAIVPDYKLGDGTSTPTEIWNRGEIRGGDGGSVTNFSSFNTVLGTDRTGLPSSAMTVVGTTSGSHMADNNNTFTIKSSDSGNKDLPEFDSLKTTLGISGNINMRVFFFAQSSSVDAHKVVSTTAVYRAGVGLNDATYVLDLSGPTVSRMEGGALVPDDAAMYSKTSKTLSLPIHNDSTGSVYVSGTTTKYEKIDITTPPASGCSWFGGTAIGSREIAPDANGGTLISLDITYGAPVAGETMVISVPYYEAEVDSENLPSNAEPLGTATITVIVVDGGLSGDPITFTITEGDSDPLEAYINIVGDFENTDADSGPLASYLYNDAENGTEITFADTDWGLAYDESESDNDPTYDLPLIFGTVDGSQGKAKVVFNPPSSLTAANSPYSTTLNIVGAYNAGDTNFDVVIPITIIVKPGAVVETYSVTYRNAANTFPSLGALLPSSTSGHAAGSSVTVSATPAANYEGTVSNLSYKFTGWTDQDGILHTPGSSFNITKNMTLTATWEAVMQSVTYKYNDGTPGTADKTVANAVQKGGTYTIGETDPTRTGWTFTGWTVTSGADSATGLKNGGSVTKVTGDVVLTAQWSQNTHHVTYSFGTVTPAGVTLPTQADVAEGGTFTVSAALAADGTVYTTAAGLGYTFTGWTVAGITGTTSAAPSATLTMGTSDITLTAQWTVKNYTVTYVKGDVPAATIASNTATVQHGAKHTVKANGNDISGITTGWQFKSWDQTGELTITDNTTITAQWKVLVTFDKNGGESGDSTAWVDHGGKATEPATEPARTGWIFGGWYDAATGGNAVDFATKTFSAPTTLYAHWTQGQSKIKYNWNYTGGSTVEREGDTGATDAAVPGSGATGAASVPTNSGYTWDGKWYTTAACTTAVTTFTFPATVGGEVTYYAKWDRDQSNIVFDFGGNDEGTADKTVTGGTGDTMKASDFPTTPGTKTNYRFDGWKNGNTTYTSTSLPKFPANKGGTLTVTAQWVGQSHITFDPGAGAFPSGTNNITQTGDVNTTTTTTPSKNPTRTGYTFGGWSATNGGTTAVTTFTFPNTVDDTTTYYAIWTPEKYTVTWNGNGGGWTSPTATTKTEQRDYDSVIPTYATEPTRTYYDFNGWYTEAACTNKVTFNTTGPKVTGNVTYYAGWTQKTSNVTVTLHVDGAEKNPGREVVVGFNGGTETIATTATKVTFSNVPQQAAAYPITVEGVAYGNVTVGDAANGSTVNYTVDFATAEVKTDGHGDASVEAKYGSMTSALTAATDYANSTPVKSNSIVVLSGQKATWKDGTAEANYSFKSWDSATGNDKANKTVTMAAAKVTHTAYFIKDRFDTNLVVNVNTANWATKGNSDTNIKEIQLVNGATATSSVSGVTVTRAHDRWEANGVSSTTVTAPYWRITTKDGGIYYEAAVPDGSATKDFFGVKVVDTKPTGCLTATVKGVSSSSTAGARVVTTVGNVTAAETHSNGYTLAAWKQTADPAVAKVSISGGTVTLASDYTNATDLEVTPTYTYAVTVRTVRVSGSTHTPTAPGGDVVVNGNTITATSTGVYRVTGLDPAHTGGYVVNVNGFDSSVSITSANANGTVDVALYSVTVNKQTAVGSETIDGTAFIAIGNTATSGSSVYLPIGAKTDTTHVVTVAAATGTKYRLKTGTGEHPWTAATYVNNQDATTTTVKTPDAGMAADITITADFVRRYTATTEVTGITSPTSTATITAGDTATSKTVDNGQIITVTFTKGTGESLKSWTGTNGTFYTDATGTTTKTPTAADTVVYFKPTGDDAKVTAEVESAVYPVEITVNLDNEAYAGRKVELRQSGTVKYTLTAGTGDNVGKYTADVLPGTYDIYVDGVTTNTLADTAKDLSFTAAQAEGDATAKANLKKEINYYTVVLKATPPTDTDTTVGGHVAFAGNATSSTVATVSKIFLAHETAVAADTFNIGSEPTDAASAHFRFDKWAGVPASNAGAFNATNTKNTTYTLPVEATLKANTNITKDTPITLTASFVKQLRVTVELASGLPTDGSLALQIKKTGDANWIASGYSVLVDEGGSATFGTTVTNTSYAFSEWTLKSGAGAFGNTGHTNTTAAAATNKGYLATGGTFAPTADSVLVLNAWQKAALEAGWRYDKVEGTYTVHGTAPDGQLKWTPRDGEETIPSDQIKLEYNATDVNFGTATPIPITAGALTQDATDKTKFTFTETFLKTLDPGFYRVTFTYTLSNPANHFNKVENVTTSAQFTISATKKQLTETKVWVEDQNAASTANPKVDARDAVIYRSHKNILIPTEELVFTWYYADNAPTEKAYLDINGGQTALQQATAAAEAVAGATKITDGVTEWGTDPHKIPTGTVKVTEDMRGKYIFAVVNVKTGSDWGEGAVITNAIPVDYDATITLQKDGSAVPDAAAGNYKVYLWPTDGGTFNKATAIEATHVAADGTNNGVYTTKNAALDATKSYHVYVNDVEDATVANHSYVKADNTAISRTNLTKTVNYYSVNLTNVTAAKVTHAKDKDNHDVGESFDSYPTFTAAVTGTTRAVASGNGVLSGTAVTATSTTWGQDYTLTWQKSTGNSALADTSSTQSSGATAATYSNGAVTVKTNIGGKLDQNTYTITGNVKDVSTGTKTAAITGTTLTVNGHVFNGSFNNGGKDGATVTFTVPRSHVADGEVNAAYNLTATPADGTTMKGYKAPANATPPTTVNANVDLQQLTAGTTALTGKFTIFIESTNLALRLYDDDNPTQNHDITASGTGSQSVTHTETVTFANYAQVVKKITLTNPGNADLKVTPKLEKSTNGGTSWTELTRAVNYVDPDNNVKIANVPNFDITLAAPSASTTPSSTFTVTIPKDLENSDDVQYRFTFTSKDGRTGQTGVGPTLTYILNIVVDPVHVDTVSTEKLRDAQGNVTQYKVKDTTIEEDAGKTGTPSYDALVTKDDADYNNPTGNADIVYEWYVAPWDAKVTLDKTTGVPKYVSGGTGNLALGAGTRGTNNLTYDPTEAEKGMALFLVAKGQRNATSAAMTPDVDKNEPVELVPFDGIITIHENTTQVTNQTEGEKYTVYLWNTAGGAEINMSDTANLIPTQWSAADNGFKSTKNLWASDPEHPDSTKPYTYKVYASIVKENATLKDTGKTITVGHRTEDVVYYKVDVADTTVHQNTYEGKLNIPDNSQYFYKTAPTKAPKATVPAVPAVTDVANSWVQTGTKVTFTYPQWTKDYDLTWTGGVSATDHAAAGNAGDVTHTNVTYSSQLNKVETQLKLNLYPVEANVKGSVGWVNKLTMALQDGAVTNTFTTKSDDGNILGIGTPTTATNERIGVGKSVTFSLPKANGYTTDADVPDQATSGVQTWEYAYGGNKTPGSDTATISVNVTGVVAQDTYDVNLTGEGLAMTVTETALPKDKTDSNTAKSGQGSIPNDTAADPVNGTVTQEVHLNYNYPTGQTVVMEVENTSSALSIFRVTRNPANTTTGNITDSAFTGGEMAAGDKEEITLTIADGLSAGTYTYSADFTFYNQAEAAGSRSAKVTYTLNVVVDPLPFTAVNTKAGTADGTYTVNEYTVKPTGATAIDDTTAATGADAKTNLTYNTDYGYQWVTSSNDVTLTSADLTWNSTAGTVTVANSVNCTGTGNNTHTYTPNAADQGRKLYLVVYAKNPSNASEAAISAPITQGYNGIVYINVDGNPKNDVLAPNPGYTVKFISGSETVTGAWQQVTTGNYAYVGSLTPGKEYTVKVSRFAGDTADATLVTLDTLDGTNIGTADANSNVTRANYFTVTAKDFTNVPYQTGTGEDFTGTTVTPAFKVGTATVASGTPVLKDQTVDAKTNTWTQDYKATWQSDSNTANVSVPATTADKGSQQTSAAANATGYSQTITARTFIGGRLDQNTYTVTGSVKGNNGSVSKLELAFKATAPDTRNFVLTTTAETGKISAGNSITDDSHNGTTGDQGDTITFTVVKGVYDITAFDGPHTTIQKVTVNTPEVDTDKTRNKETLTPAVTADGRVFTVYVEDSALALGVTDGADMTKGNHAVSSGTATNLDTVETNHKFADNVQVHYFNATTGTFDLKLNNSGNTDLVLSAPAVYKLNPGAITGTETNLKSVTLGTNVVTGSGYTDANLTISGLVAANTALAVNATQSNAGKVELKQTAVNKDDAIYVIAFPSTYTDSNSASHAGPTVYYVVDLTVQPLPIKQVTAETDPSKTDGTLRLKDFVASGADANDGLNSVLVDHDGVSTTANKGAKDAGLAEADISYVWVTAPTTKTKAQVEAALTLGATAMTSSDSDVKVTAYTGKTCTPTAAEQGLNFYLVAFRSNADANASEFAVSNAVYAQVVISMEARRTGTTDKLTVVKIASGDQTSNDGKVTVAAAGTNVPFTADKADNATPADATYYFVNWAADPTGGITVNGSDRLKMSYAATQQATVIGYYDLLPTLTGFSSYNIGADRIDDGTNAASYRTLTYAPNDGSGSGKVEIWVTPAAGSAFQNGSTAPRMLTQEAFETIAGAPMTLSAPFGGAGTYVLTDAWICGNLVGGNSYTITFYDVEKGQFTDPVATANATGYAGYDRSKLINITSGEKTVIARVEDTDPVTDDIQGHGKVQVKGKTDGAVGLTSTATTKGGSATVIATPDAGYVFDHWTMIDPADGTGASIDSTTSATTTVSSSTAAQVVVEASFRKAQVGVEGGKAAVFYGDNKFDGTPTQLSLTGETTVTGLNWTYAKLTGTDLTDYLTATAANGGLGMSAADAAKVVAKMTASNAWLALNGTTGVFSVNANATGVNVEKKSGNDVDNELVVYVKVTETATDQTFIVPFTVDIKTSPLKIVTASTPDSTAQTDPQKTAEGTAYVGFYGSTPNHDDKVLYEHFHYTNVQNGKNAGNIVDLDANHANHAAGANPWDTSDGADNSQYGVVTGGYWTVAPTTFDGTGANEYVEGANNTNANSYTFTYHYTGATDTAEDDYNYTNATIDMVIPVLVPEMSLKFADTLHTTTAGGDPADLTLTAGTHSAQDGTTNVAGGAPQSLAYAKDANRKDEHITYLDEEPVFHVTLQKIGAIQEIELTMEDVDGFTTTLPRFPVDTDQTTESKSFDIKLSHMLSDSKLWAGTHTITVKAKGYTDLTDRTKFIEASYELEIVVDPKLVTSLDVTTTPTRPTPASVTGTQKDSPADTPLPTTDPKGNRPIKNSTATWTPTTDPTQVEVKVEIDPNYKYDPDIADATELVVTGKPTPDPITTRDDDTHVTITQPIPYLMHGDEHGGTTTGPRVNHTNGASILVGGDPATLGSYTIDLGAYGAGVYDVDWTVKNNTLVGDPAAGQGVGATLGTLPARFDLAKDGKQLVTLDLTGVDTTKAGSFVLTLEGVGVAVKGADRTENNLIKSTYTFTLSITSPGGGGGVVEPPCPCKVFYMIGMHGTTEDPTIEDVSENGTPAAPPTVTALEGYVFKGWSLTNPATLKEGEKVELVDPKTVTVKGEAMTFYAVIQEYVRPFHQHYVIGYPNGTFGPADDINRASVATIIARAVLPGFVEGADYGNPGGYSDVEGHWAESAIAYCSKFGVFEGMPDGTFQPDRPITRQELAVAVARLDGILEPGDMSFTDIDEAGDWAMGGIYTAYTKGWVNGYPDGSFKPLNNIRRDETVKLFNAYLNRGVDAEGLSDLKEYVHSGVASNNTENGVDEYMTWPDVPKDQWAYYEIIEAANDHEYRVDDEGNYTVPEHWDKCWIDERWRYGDDPEGAAAAAGAAVSAGFRVWFD